MIKINIDKCSYSDNDNNLIIKIESNMEESQILEKNDIYNLIVTSIYLYILSNVHKDKEMHKFDAFDLQSMLEHFPYINCILDKEIFEFFLNNDSDMFVMLESLTLQSYLLSTESDKDVDISLFKTLNQKLISKIREYKSYVMYLDKKDIDEIENVFVNIFKIDLKVISYIDFTKIREMMENNKNIEQYQELIGNKIGIWIKEVMQFNTKSFDNYQIFLNNNVIYNC